MSALREPRCVLCRDCPPADGECYCVACQAHQDRAAAVAKRVAGSGKKGASKSRAAELGNGVTRRRGRRS